MMKADPRDFDYGTAARPETSVRAFDLTGKDRQLEAALAAMTQIGSTFVRYARRSLPFLARYRTRIVSGAVQMVRSGEEPAILSSRPNFVTTLFSQDGSGWANIILDASTIAVTLEGALGGMGTFDSVSLAPELTSAQKALVGRITDSLCHDLAMAVREQVGLVLAPRPKDKKAPDKPAAPVTGDALYVVCEIEGLSVPAAIAIGASAEALETAARMQGGPDKAEQKDPKMAEALQTVPVEVVVELGKVKLDLRRVLGFQVGDVIRLPTATDDLIPVRVAGVEKFSGVPSTSRGQMAIEIRARHGE